MPGGRGAARPEWAGAGRFYGLLRGDFRPSALARHQKASTPDLPCIIHIITRKIYVEKYKNDTTREKKTMYIYHKGEINNVHTCTCYVGQVAEGCYDSNVYFDYGVTENFKRH